MVVTWCQQGKWILIFPFPQTCNLPCDSWKKFWTVEIQITHCYAMDTHRMWKMMDNNYGCQLFFLSLSLKIRNLSTWISMVPAYENVFWTFKYVYFHCSNSNVRYTNCEKTFLFFVKYYINLFLLRKQAFLGNIYFVGKQFYSVSLVQLFFF